MSRALPIAQPTLSTSASVITSSYCASVSSVSLVLLPALSPFEGAIVAGGSRCVAVWIQGRVHATGLHGDSSVKVKGAGADGKQSPIQTGEERQCFTPLVNTTTNRGARPSQRKKQGATIATASTASQQGAAAHGARETGRQRRRPGRPALCGLTG